MDLHPLLNAITLVTQVVAGAMWVWSVLTMWEIWR